MLSNNIIGIIMHTLLVSLFSDVRLTFPCISGIQGQYHRSPLGSQSKCLRGGLIGLMENSVCPAVSEGRSIMLIVGVCLSPEFTFDHFCMFANAVCISAVLS